MKRIIFIVIMTATLLLSGCDIINGSRPALLADVRLPLGYIPNVQFAPLYVALEKGYFKEEGLNVQLDYSQENDNLALVGSGELEFAVVSGEQVLLARAQGLPVVYIAAWYKDFPVGISALKDKNILAPADLKGRVIGIPGLYGASYIGLRALLAAGGLQEKDVSLKSINYTQVESLITSVVEAAVIYVPNEPVQLAARGYQADTLRVSDYLTLIGNGLITNERVLRETPQLAKSMARALLRGVQDALANPDEAFEISKMYVENLGKTDPEIQKAVLSASIELWKTSPAGWSDAQAWQNMHALLLEMGMLKSPLDIQQAFSNEYLPEL